MSPKTEGRREGTTVGEAYEGLKEHICHKKTFHHPEPKTFKVLFVRHGQAFLTGLWAGHVSGVISFRSQPLKDEQPTEPPKTACWEKDPRQEISNELAINLPLISGRRHYPGLFLLYLHYLLYGRIINFENVVPQLLCVTRIMGKVFGLEREPRSPRINHKKNYLKGKPRTCAENKWQGFKETSSFGIKTWDGKKNRQDAWIFGHRRWELYLEGKSASQHPWWYGFTQAAHPARERGKRLREILI